MRSLQQVPLDKLNQFLKILSEEGFGPDEIDRVCSHPSLAQEMAGAIWNKEIFVSTSDQVENIKKWNGKYKWGLLDSDFSGLGKAPWKKFNAGPLTTPLLAIYLKGKGGQSGLRRTFSQLWQVVVDEQGDCPCYSLIHGKDLQSLELLSGIDYKPGLVWMEVDLGSQWDPINPGPNLSGVRPLGVEVLAAAAQFPLWARLTLKTAPAPLMAGFQPVEGRLPCLEHIWQGDGGLFSHLQLRWEDIKQLERAMNADTSSAGQQQMHSTPLCLVS